MIPKRMDYVSEHSQKIVSWHDFAKCSGIYPSGINRDYEDV